MKQSILFLPIRVEIVNIHKKILNLIKVDETLSLYSFFPNSNSPMSSYTTTKIIDFLQISNTRPKTLLVASTLNTNPTMREIIAISTYFHDLNILSDLSTVKNHHHNDYSISLTYIFCLSKLERNHLTLLVLSIGRSF